MPRVNKKNSLILIFTGFINKNRLLILILSLGAFLRLYKLNELPGEIYGDIVLVYGWINNILAGKGLPPFFLSVGPLYFYLSAPIVRLFGDSYLVLKLISVSFGLVTILVTYLLAYEITRARYVALSSAILLAASKWHIIHSRLGDHRVIVSLFSGLIYIFLLRFYAKKRYKDLVVLSILSGLSLYTYIPAWALPVSVFATLIIFCMSRRFAAKNSLAILGLYVFFVLLMSMPILKTLTADSSNFFGNGYIGNKLFTAGSRDLNKALIFVDNYKKSLLMFNVRGDVVFRNNPPLEPHLDHLTGGLFVIGLLTLALVNRKNLLFTALPIAILLIPGSLVVNFPNEVPNSARTIAVIPFTFTLAGIGLHQVRMFMRQYLKEIYLSIFVGILLVAVICFNVYSYFITYRDNLPNHNIPFGKVIAQQIDKLPQDASVYVVGCCWGEWGQPEPKGIEYALKKSREIRFIERGRLSCSSISTDEKYYIVWDPRESLSLELWPCLSGGVLNRIKSKYNETIFIEYKNF